MAVKKNELDIRPDEDGKNIKTPTAVDWQGGKSKEIDKATSPAALAALASDADNLKRIFKGLDFSGEFSDADALAKTQIAALSIFSMNQGNEAFRRRYTKLLIDLAAGGNKDLAMFCFEQLRRCAFKEQAAEIRRAARIYKDANIADFAEMVAYEISL